VNTEWDSVGENYKYFSPEKAGTAKWLSLKVIAESTSNSKVNAEKLKEIMALVERQVEEANQSETEEITKNDKTT
jgi:hypothetical protein